jgi:hypothetical protein
MERFRTTLGDALISVNKSKKKDDGWTPYVIIYYDGFEDSGLNAFAGVDVKKSGLKNEGVLKSKVGSLI